MSSAFPQMESGELRANGLIPARLPTVNTFSFKGMRNLDKGP
jgi:hypothetical protein